MNVETKVLNLFNNGYLRSADVANENIPTIYLSRLVNKGIIERVERGLYIKKDFMPDDFVILQYCYNNAIFSNMTALYLYGLSERLPIKYDITVNSGYSGALQKINNTNLFYVKKELLDLGLTTFTLNNGSTINIYDLERTICDVIRNKKRLDCELVNKALRNYYYSKSKNTIKLYKYAKRLGIYKKVKNTFEVLR